MEKILDILTGNNGYEPVNTEPDKPIEQPKQPRTCYCEKGDLFCGKCEVCDNPGHIKHHPGGPGTGSWCDKHYEEEKKMTREDFFKNIK